MGQQSFQLLHEQATSQYQLSNGLFYRTWELDLKLDFFQVNLFPKWVFKPREDTRASFYIGSELINDMIKDELLDYDENLKVFSTCFFEGNSQISETLWRDFQNKDFFFPKIHVLDNKVFVKLLSKTLKDEKIIFDILGPETASFKLINLSQSPSFTDWDKKVNAIKKTISEGSLKKLVLSRKTVFETSGFFPTKALVEKFSLPTNYLFVYYAARDNIFMSCTPERLVKKEGHSIYTEALAGTSCLGEKLEESSKDNFEHDLVVNQIKEDLESLKLVNIRVKEKGIEKLSHIQHLKTPIEANSVNNIKTQLIIEKLHPTPALGGFPKSYSLPMIKSLEKNQRGLFGGIVGFETKDHADFCVGIRSALFQKNTLHVFAGAGIVADSDSKSEWLETENKMKNFYEQT